MSKLGAGETLKILGVGVCLILIVTGWTWCEWRGYKDRFPHGGIWGFITSCNGDRK